MNEFEKLHKQEFEKNNKLARDLRDIGIDMCYAQEIPIKEVSYERVTLENESWININFEIDCTDPMILAALNLELSKKLASNEDFINSEIEFIPSFISRGDNYVSKFPRIS